MKKAIQMWSFRDRVKDGESLLEALKIAGIEKMPIYKAMEHILEHEHIDLLVKPVSRRYS